MIKLCIHILDGDKPKPGKPHDQMDPSETQQYFTVTPSDSKCCSCCPSQKSSGDRFVINITKPCKLIMNIESDSASDCDCSKCPKSNQQSQKDLNKSQKETKTGK